MAAIAASKHCGGNGNGNSSSSLVFTSSMPLVSALATTFIFNVLSAIYSVPSCGSTLGDGYARRGVVKRLELNSAGGAFGCDRCFSISSKDSSIARSNALI